MTQRSIQSGAAPQVIIHTGADVNVRGVEGERVSAETNGRWGVKVERKDGAIKVDIGGSGEVLVPYNSSLKVYAGKNITVQSVGGEVTAYAGRDLGLREVARLVQAQAGGAMDIDCREVTGTEVTYSAGRDLRLYVRELPGAQVKIKDLGGAWEARLGNFTGPAPVILTLKAGGDVTIVTDLNVTALPPDFILGKVERPGTKTEAVKNEA